MLFYNFSKKNLELLFNITHVPKIFKYSIYILHKLPYKGKMVLDKWGGGVAKMTTILDKSYLVSVYNSPKFCPCPQILWNGNLRYDQSFSPRWFYWKMAYLVSLNLMSHVNYFLVILEIIYIEYNNKHTQIYGFEKFTA